MSSDFINGLVATAAPVKRRHMGLDFVAVVGIAILQLIGLVQFFDTEIVAAAYASDPVRMTAKFIVFGSLALASMGLAVWSFDPAARRVDTGLIVSIATALVVSVLFFELSPGATVTGTFHPAAGVFCAGAVAALSLPVTLMLGILMMSGASVQPRRSAFLCGLAGGAFGAFLFSLQCPQVSFWYLSMWYGGTVALVAVVAALIMPRFVRW